jgi:hypothetical protein
MIANRWVLVYVFVMSSQESVIDQLTFQDGEEVLVSHLNNGKRAWLHSTEAFSRSVFHDDHIEFRLLNDDGVDIVDTRKVERTYQESYFRALGDVAYSAAVLFDNGKWQWNRTAVPLPQVLESFRQSELAPLGANDFSFTVQEGDGNDGEFRLRTIMQALVDRSFLVGADPGYFVHDMEDHSVGMAAIDDSCMESLRSFALISQELREQSLLRSKSLALSIADGLDYYSYFDFFATKMAVRNFDPLLTDVLQSASRINKRKIGHMKSILRQNGYEVTPGLKVIRNAEITQYYAEALQVLDPKTTSAK